MEKHEYKMYAIVLRQLDGINKGVQSAHSVCEYVRKHWKDKDLQQWLNSDKTLIILNGGTSVDLKKIKEKFEEGGVKYETFEEEDLDGLTTSISVLADERVWDREDWVSYQVYADNADAYPDYGELDDDEELAKEYDDYIGGHENAVKKEILNNLKIA